MSSFKFKPADWVPYRDVDVLDMCRSKTREDYLKINKEKPNLNVSVVEDEDFWWMWATDMFYRIVKGAEENRKVVMILPNPAPIYSKVAYLINKFHVDCRTLYTFNMDEWADDQGNVAPEDYHAGFMCAFKRFFYTRIDKKLRPPESQCIGPNNKNIKDYSKMIEALGEADVVYMGPGWSGHTAFIDPVPEFGVDGDKVVSVAEWAEMGARIASLHPLTIAQNSMHASFGKSGDVSFVPPKAATIGPRDILKAKTRFEMHFFTTAGTDISWQRFMSRLVLWGPPTPLVPGSVVQLAPSDVFVCETIAKAIETDLKKQY
jgi:6-phosphogluconolactonase/Glucosamine-6-phosphate isomerase/deaminase